MEVRYWQQPAEASISSTDEKEETESLHIYTDGSETEKGVGSGVVFLNQGNALKAYNASQIEHK